MGARSSSTMAMSATQSASAYHPYFSHFHHFLASVVLFSAHVIG